MGNLHKVKITDLVKDDYKYWKQGSMIFIFSGTGSGKTTLALEKITISYIDKGKRVLYLVPRELLREEINKIMQSIIAKSEYKYHAENYNNNFDIWTYQHLENLLLNKINIKHFDLIICDEFHYFITDCTFNQNTQVSYNYIFYDNKNSTKLFLSATPDNIMEYLKCEIKENYLIEPIEEPYIDYDVSLVTLAETLPEPEKQDTIEDIIKKIDNVLDKNITQNGKKEHIEAKNLDIYMYKLPNHYDYLNVQYLTNNDNIYEIIKNSPKEEKTIIFVNNKKNGEDIQNKLNKNNIKNIFITADNKYTENKKGVNTLINTNTFPQKVFISTSVLDVGVNFLDIKITNIIIEATELVEFIQMLGRIRVIEENQKVSLFIHARTSNYFQHLRDFKIQNNLDCIEFLEKYSNISHILEDEFIPGNTFQYKYKNYKNFLCLNNNSSIELNKLTAFRFRELYTLYNNICNKIKKDKYGFIKQQLQWLGLENTFSEENFYYVKMQKRYPEIIQKGLEEETKRIKNKMSKSECMEILEKIQERINNFSNKIIKGKLSIKKFNFMCKNYNISYCIAQRSERINKERKTIYYLLSPNDDRINTLKLSIQ